jgi:hypothetical protein
MINCRKKTAGVTATILPVFTLLAFLSREKLIGLSRLFPECSLYKMTGYLCPACGNTRSVRALFGGDILISIGYNATPVLIFSFAVMFYIEFAAFALGKRIRIIPRNYGFLAAFLTALALYYLLRNFILFLTLCA